MESWKTLLHVACICNHERILEVSKDHDCKGVPFVQYHRNCWSVFTMKGDLEKIQKSESKVGSLVIEYYTITLQYYIIGIRNIMLLIRSSSNF